MTQGSAMSYADRRGLRAYSLVREFVREKVRHEIRPDMLYRGMVSTNNNGDYDTKNYDAWLVVAQNDWCAVALEDEEILVGRLKWVSRLFGWDRNSVDSYGFWKKYYAHAIMYQLSDQLPVAIADAIIDTLAPKKS